MNDTVLDAIAAASADLTKLVDAPSPENLGYGRDLRIAVLPARAGIDLTVDLEETDPQSPAAIATAVWCRLTTPRGTLLDDADYGLDVRAYLNRGVPLTEVRDLAGLIRGELTKDDRIEDAEVTVTLTGTNSAELTVLLKPADPRITPFTLTFSVTSDDVLLEAIH